MTNGHESERTMSPQVQCFCNRDDDPDGHLWDPSAGCPNQIVPESATPDDR